MRGAWWVLAIVGCGPSATGGAESTSGVVHDDTTIGSEPDLRVARRYPLLDDEACHHVAIGDLDADGHGDLLVVPGPAGFIHAQELRRLHTFRGGAPELSAPELHCCLEVGDPANLDLVDVNGDGRADPVYAVDHEVGSELISVVGSLDLLVRGPLGGYLPAQSVARGRIGPRRPLFAIGTLAGETPALVASDGEAGLRILVADGRSLTASTDDVFALSDFAFALATTDLDDDGIDDVLALLPDRIAMVRSVGDGTLATLGETTPTAMGSAMLVGDLDGNGSRDVVLVGDEAVTVGLLSSAGIDWHPQPGVTIGSPAVLVDVDGDAALDLVAAAGASLVAYRGDGEGSFAAPPVAVSYGAGDWVGAIVAGDLDGDARPDIAVCDELGVLVVSSGASP